jgi:hypothetical protein
MEKQVKVNVSWTKDGVKLSTDKGMAYYFEVSRVLRYRDSCELIVSGLVSSLIIPTVKAAFDASDNYEFSFEFKVIDKKES